MRLLDPQTMDEGDWPAGSEKVRAYVEGFARHGSRHFVSNLETQVMVLRDGDRAMPVTINDGEYDNSYVCSPYTAYALYSKEEMRLLNRRWLSVALGALADLTGIMLKAARINQVVHINNWMLSTNLYSSSDELPVQSITAALCALYPHHYLCFRSLNEWANGKLLSQFNDAGYKRLASRQVYVFERGAGEWGLRSNAHHDRRLLARTAYRIVRHREFETDDFARMAELYRQLYIEKYSRHNPIFTTSYLELCHRSSVMIFFGLRRPDGLLDGVLGLFIRDQTVTAPIVGYATGQDRKLGLYRLLMTLVFEFAHENGYRVNLSSGAASFKRLRGGKPVIEYSVIYDRHLSPGRRLAVSALAIPVNGVGVPLMRKLQL